MIFRFVPGPPLRCSVSLDYHMAGFQTFEKSYGGAEVARREEGEGGGLSGVEGEAPRHGQQAGLAPKAGANSRTPWSALVFGIEGMKTETGALCE